MLTIKTNSLTHLPQDVLNLIAENLDFTSCRNLQATCKDIYTYPALMKTKQCLGEQAFKQGKLHMVPTPTMLMLSPTTPFFENPLLKYLCGFLMFSMVPGASLLLTETVSPFIAALIMVGPGLIGFACISAALFTVMCCSDVDFEPEKKLLQFDPDGSAAEPSDEFEADIVNGFDDSFSLI